MGRVIGLVVLLVVLYAIITQPLTSAAMTRSGGSALAGAGTSFVQFLSALTTGSSSTSRTASTSRSGTGSSSYTVRSGDTLSTIGRAHGTSAGTLATRNGLSDPDRITPGQRLSLG